MSSLASAVTPQQKSPCVQNLTYSATVPNIMLESRILDIPQSQSCHHPQTSLFLLKRKHEVNQQQNANPFPKICQRWRASKWKPPYLSQEKAGEGGGVGVWKRSKLLELTSAAAQKRQSEACPAQEPGGASGVHEGEHFPQPTAKHKIEPSTNRPRSSYEGVNTHSELQSQSNAGSVYTTLTSDPRVMDSGKLNLDEKMQLLEKTAQANVLVLTMVYRDGTTQLDSEPVSTA